MGTFCERSIHPPFESISGLYFWTTFACKLIEQIYWTKKETFGSTSCHYVCVVRSSHQEIFQEIVPWNIWTKFTWILPRKNIFFVLLQAFSLLMSQNCTFCGLRKPLNFHWFKMSCLTCLFFSCVYCFFLKVYWRKFETFPICSCSYKNNTLKVSLSLSYEFSSFLPVKFAECLFTNIHK